MCGADCRKRRAETQKLFTAAVNPLYFTSPASEQLETFYATFLDAVNALSTKNFTKICIY